MTKLLVLAMAYAGLTHASCTYNYSKADTAISWTAFKTEKKVPVGGQFTDFNIAVGIKSSPLDLLRSATFSINTQSVDTKNKARDSKIMKHVFSTILGGVSIRGLVKTVNEKTNTAYVFLMMNNQEIIVPMNYKIKNEKMSLNGEIDLLKFAMGDQVAAIQKACYVHHKGKTWSDVKINIESLIVKNCE